MIRQACFSMRRGTVFSHKGEAVRCIDNDCLARLLTVAKADGTLLRLRYAPGQELHVLSRPFRIRRMD